MLALEATCLFFPLKRHSSESLLTTFMRLLARLNVELQPHASCVNGDAMTKKNVTGNFVRTNCKCQKSKKSQAGLFATRDERPVISCASARTPEMLDGRINSLSAAEKYLLIFSYYSQKFVSPQVQRMLPKQLTSQPFSTMTYVIGKRLPNWPIRSK